MKWKRLFILGLVFTILMAGTYYYFIFSGNAVRVFEAPDIIPFIFSFSEEDNGISNPQSFSGQGGEDLSNSEILELNFSSGIGTDVMLSSDNVLSINKKNLLENPSFELDNLYYPSLPNGLAEYWWVWNPLNFRYSVSLDNTTSVEGNKSQLINVVGSNDKVYFMTILSDVLPETQYTFSAYVKSNNTRDFNTYLVFQSYRDNEHYLGQTQSLSINSSNFYRLNATITTPLNTNTLRLIIVFNATRPNSNGSFWVDGAQLERGSSVTAFTPGYTSLTGQYLSSPIYRAEPMNKIQWTGSAEPGSNITFQIRSASTQAGLDSSPWYGFNQTLTSYPYVQGRDYRDEYKVNSIHTALPWIQWRVNFSSQSYGYSPSLYNAQLLFGSSIPEIRWINALDALGNQKYAYTPGSVINFSAEIRDYKGDANINEVTLSVSDIQGNTLFSSVMEEGSQIDDLSKYFIYNLVIPAQMPRGVYYVNINASNIEGVTSSKHGVLKIVDPYTIAPQKMTLGALANDLGFYNYHTPALTIAAYESYNGIEIWKLGINWNSLEWVQNHFDEEYLLGILHFLDAAQNKGVKVQIGISQVNWPLWVDNGKSDSYDKKYNYRTTSRLANTWSKLAQQIKDHPALDSYLIIAEENYIFDENRYLQELNEIVSSIRRSDPNLSHRIVIRPNVYDRDNSSRIRSRIAQDGNHDYDYGTGVYPTSWYWEYPTYSSPLSDTSFFRMSSALSRSPLVFGGIGGVGEIGFFSTPLDNFGDDEKLLGFERGLKQAYEQGMDEFMIWGGEFTFDNPTIYFTKLKEFRDALILNPRQSEYDVRVMIDNKETLVKEIGQRALTELNMSEQPYLYLVRYLDHNGYSWFQTEPSARIMPNIIYKRTINLSQVKGLNEVQMNQTVSGILSGITPSGAYYPWVNNSNYSRSMTGMVNPYNISFIGGCITCDVFALSSEKLRIYAPRNTSVQIEYPQDVIILLLNDETVPFSKNIISSGKTLVRFNTSNAIKTSDIQFISGGPILTSINPNQIYNNTENTLVLTGSGFSRNCRIMLFDLLVGAPFITTYINSTHINFTVPAGVPLGVYSLSVMGNYSGQILRSQPINVTVTNPPLLFCGDGICNNGETCSSCSIDCGRCRGNGGGGGGGDSGITLEVNLDLSDSLTTNLSRGDILKILFNGKVQQVQIISVKDNVLTLGFVGINRRVLVSLGQEVGVNLDNSSEDDVKIKLNNLFSTSKAGLTLRKIVRDSAIISNKSGNQSIPVSGLPGAVMNKNKTWIILAITSSVLVLVIVYVLLKRRARHLKIKELWALEEKLRKMST